MARLWLRVLGIVLDIRCRTVRCRDGIARHMSGHVLDETRLETPDLILEISMVEFDRFLYRERPEDEAGTALQGVRAIHGGSTAFEDWTSHLPPLVPFHHPANAGRFVAVHAACIRLPLEACVLFPGHRGAGKTTVAAELCRRHGGRLLTDEAAFLHRRTSLVEPLTLAMGIREGGGAGGKTLVPARDICGELENSPRAITHIVFLKRHDLEAAIRPVPPERAFARLMEHQIDVGAPRDEVVVTLARLCKEIPAFEFLWNDYNEVPANVASLCRTISG
jgi:hypothetical protein